MKKEIIIAVLTTIIATLIILIVVGLTMEDGETVSVPIDKPISTDMSVFKHEFIAGCNEDGSAYGNCACAYDVLVEDMGEQGVLDMSVEYLKTEKLPARAVELVMPCFQ